MENKQEKRNWLTLDLQHFAEQNEDDENNETTNDEHEQDDNQDDDNDKNDTNNGDKSGTGDNPDNKRDEEPKFTQADIDRIIQERLDRERKKQEREREKEEQRKKEEDGDYKDLYEDLKGKLEAQREEALDVKKESLLAKAGYDEEQVQRYKRYLDGESDDDLQAALDDLKKDIPPKKNYGDPNPGNGSKQPPKKKNLEEKGKSRYQRLKEKGKIRGRK